jgi:UDP-N-acetyl-D-galactosamine dehydrogenase
VGGHCIGVDPYYLTYKAEDLGYRPEVILAGRRINEGMGPYIAERLIKKMTQQKINVVHSRVLVLGLSFKENTPELRNTKVVDLIRTLQSYHVQVDVHDPWVDPEDAMQEYGLELTDEPSPASYDAIVIAVAHKQFKSMGAQAVLALGKARHVIFDVKYLFPQDAGFYRL